MTWVFKKKKLYTVYVPSEPEMLGADWCNVGFALDRIRDKNSIERILIHSTETHGGIAATWAIQKAGTGRLFLQKDIPVVEVTEREAKRLRKAGKIDVVLLGPSRKHQAQEYADDSVRVRWLGSNPK